jgi:D-ribose pyranose/furanose isomerase RbsD
MLETGIINRELAGILSRQGHGDWLMVTDAGFAIPKDADVLDLSLTENVPTVPDLLAVLSKFFSVEKMILANQTSDRNPGLFGRIVKSFGEGVEVELVDHATLKEISKKSKSIIRTGDFTAFGNVILVSGAGNRWYVEKKG